MKIAVVGTALLGLLIFGLGALEWLVRLAGGRSTGHGDDDLLHRLEVAQSRAVAYCPVLAILMLMLQYWGAANWIVWVEVAAVASPYIDAVGVLTCRSLQDRAALRIVGAAGTYVCGALLCGVIIWASLTR